MGLPAPSFQSCNLGLGMASVSYWQVDSIATVADFAAEAMADGIYEPRQVETRGKERHHSITIPKNFQAVHI